MAGLAAEMTREMARLRRERPALWEQTLAWQRKRLVREKGEAEAERALGELLADMDRIDAEERAGVAGAKPAEGQQP